MYMYIMSSSQAAVSKYPGEECMAFSFIIFSFLLLSSSSSVAANREGDALIALKEKLDDPNNVLQSWDGTLSTPCTWFLVTCDKNDKVKSINLGKSNLSGVLVPQLGELEYLQILELYANNISGEIPVELGNLTNLKSLDLYDNALTGPIPSTLGKLTQLQFMRLNLNKLTGNVPQSFANLYSLTFLDLTSNALTGTNKLDHGAFLNFTCASFWYGNPGLECGA